MFVHSGRCLLVLLSHVLGRARFWGRMSVCSKLCVSAFTSRLRTLSSMFLEGASEFRLSQHRLDSLKVSTV